MQKKIFLYPKKIKQHNQKWDEIIFLAWASYISTSVSQVLYTSFRVCSKKLRRVMKILSTELKSPIDLPSDKKFFLFRITPLIEISAIFYHHRVIKHQISEVSFAGRKQLLVTLFGFLPPYEYSKSSYFVKNMNNWREFGKYIVFFSIHMGAENQIKSPKVVFSPEMTLRRCDV